MPSRKIVFVVGAGASNEVGLPLGTQLKAFLAKILAFPLDHQTDRFKGDESLLAAFAALDQPAAGMRRSANAGVLVSRAIVDAMSSAQSIDNFIEAHSKNELLVKCGKLGIASAILAAERSSKIAPQRNHDDMSAPDAIADTWFEGFFHLVSEGCAFEDVATALSQIAIVCFNYDRCIEQALVDSIRRYYQVDRTKALAAAKHVEIVRPYGSVGALHPLFGDFTVPFGASLSSEEILKSSGRILTFSERSGARIGHEREQRLVREAGMLVFLGFAFHRMNMNLLFPGGASSTLPEPTQIVATAYRMSQDDVDLVKADLKVRAAANGSVIIVRQDLTSAALFRDYSRRLRAAWYN